MWAKTWRAGQRLGISFNSPYVIFPPSICEVPNPLLGPAQSAFRTVDSGGAESLVSHVGNTPLLAPGSFGAGNAVRLYGKAEWFNPTGSVKDRAALSIISAAERDRTLTPDKTILDATSGNAGISYAMIAAA